MIAVNSKIEFLRSHRNHNHLLTFYFKFIICIKKIRPHRCEQLVLVVLSDKTCDCVTLCKILIFMSNNKEFSILFLSMLILYAIIPNHTEKQHLYF